MCYRRTLRVRIDAKRDGRAIAKALFQQAEKTDKVQAKRLRNIAGAILADLEVA